MSTSDNLKSKTISGIFWQFLQKISNQSVSFIVSVVLARLLSPDDYGVVALAGMFTVLLGIFSDGGLGPALIQKKDADEKDFNTMFVTQLVFSSFVYVVVFFLAPCFAKLYENDLLTDIIRVSAMTMPLGALAGVQNSVVTRRMMFRWYFYASLGALFASACVGIYLAFAGYGAWALVFQSITSTVTSTIIIFFLLDWHPKFQFYYDRFLPLFKNGLKFMGTSFVSVVTMQFRSYALGLKYSPTDLAYYNRGEGIPVLACNNIDATIQSVLFPALAQIQDDKDAVRRALRRAIRISTFILMPVLFGIAAISDKLVIIVFTEKWAPSIPFMQYSCFCLAVGVMCNVNLQALKARGKIGLILKLEFIKKPIMLLIVIGTMMISPLAIIQGMLVFNIFVYFVNSYPNKKNIDYSYQNQLKDVAPNIFLALSMAVLVYFVGRNNWNIYLSVSVQILLGVLYYISVSALSKNESFYYVLNTIKEKRKKQ